MLLPLHGANLPIFPKIMILARAGGRGLNPVKAPSVSTPLVYSSHSVTHNTEWDLIEGSKFKRSQSTSLIKLWWKHRPKFSIVQLVRMTWMNAHAWVNSGLFEEAVNTWQQCRVSALLCSSRSRGNRRQSMLDDMSLASPRSKWSEQSLKTYKSSSTERESVKTNTVVSPLERNNSLLLNDRPKTCAHLPTKLPRHIKNVTSVKLQFCKEYHSKGSTGQEKAL